MDFEKCKYVGGRERTCRSAGTKRARKKYSDKIDSGIFETGGRRNIVGRETASIKRNKSCAADLPAPGKGK